MVFRPFGLATVLTLALSAPAHAINQLIWVFDGDYAGVDGSVVVQYDDPKYSGATIKADLNFKTVDMKALRALDGNCTADTIKEYKWHIHTKWFEPGARDFSSTKFGDCAKSITGNHYDPYKICGPASEYVDTPACAGRVKDYKCTPDAYKKNFAACESGDLSAKFGSFKPNAKGAFKGEWFDLRFPFWTEITPQWSLVIHAVCGTATPRIACAHGSPWIGGGKVKAAPTSETTQEEDTAKVRVKIRVSHKTN